jgi:hypothetical protein
VRGDSSLWTCGARLCNTVGDGLRHVRTLLEGTDLRGSVRNDSPDLRTTSLDMGVTVCMERPRVYGRRRGAALLLVVSCS